MDEFAVHWADAVAAVDGCLEQVEAFARARKFDARTQRDLQISIDERVFNLVKTKSGPVKLQNARHDVQAMYQLCQYFITRQWSDVRQRYAVFETLFLGRENTDTDLHVLRVDFLGRLLLLAMATDCTAMLTDAAFWLQKLSLSKSQQVMLRSFCAKVAASFADNEAKCFPCVLRLMETCPSLALTMLPFLVDELDFYVMPPPYLLHAIADWLYQQPRSFFTPFREMNVGLKSSASNPVPKVVNQCLEKLIAICVTHSILADGDIDEAVAVNVSKLRYALLIILQSVPRTSNNEICCTLSGKRAADMLRLISEYEQRTKSFDTKLNSALDAFAELMVTAVLSHVFTGSRSDFNMSVFYQLTYGHTLLASLFNMLT